MFFFLTNRNNNYNNKNININSSSFLCETVFNFFFTMNIEAVCIFQNIKIIQINSCAFLKIIVSIIFESLEMATLRMNIQERKCHFFNSKHICHTKKRALSYTTLANTCDCVSFACTLAHKQESALTNNREQMFSPKINKQQGRYAYAIVYDNHKVNKAIFGKNYASLRCGSYFHTILLRIYDWNRIFANKVRNLSGFRVINVRNICLLKWPEQLWNKA